MTRAAERGGGAMRRCPVARRVTAPGDTLLVLEGERARNGWLLAGEGWVPPPRLDAEHVTAAWHVSYCGVCDKHIARLSATVPLQTGDEVVCASLPSPDLDTVLWPYEVTFDGGARHIHPDHKVAGAGATLWHHGAADSVPVQIASIVVALPDVQDSQIAEASGCRAALAGLANIDTNVRAARVVGDNLAVVRYGAGTGRFQRSLLQAQMELALGPLAQRGWRLQWHAVRRRLNKAADRLATLGVFWAEALRRQGIRGVRTHIVWHTSSTPPSEPPEQFPDPRVISLEPGLVQNVVEDLEDLVRAGRGRRGHGHP